MWKWNCTVLLNTHLVSFCFQLYESSCTGVRKYGRKIYQKKKKKKKKKGLLFLTFLTELYVSYSYSSADKFMDMWYTEIFMSHIVPIITSPLLKQERKAKIMILLFTSGQNSFVLSESYYTYKTIAEKWWSTL